MIFIQLSRCGDLFTAQEITICYSASLTATLALTWLITFRRTGTRFALVISIWWPYLLAHLRWLYALNHFTCLYQPNVFVSIKFTWWWSIYPTLDSHHAYSHSFCKVAVGYYSSQRLRAGLHHVWHNPLWGGHLSRYLAFHDSTPLHIL